MNDIKYTIADVDKLLPGTYAAFIQATNIVKEDPEYTSNEKLKLLSRTIDNQEESFDWLKKAVAVARELSNGGEHFSKIREIFIQLKKADIEILDLYNKIRGAC